VVVDLLLTITSSQTFTQLPKANLELYTIATSSLFLHHAFLAKLSNFIHGFTTPGQISKITQSTLERLRAACAEFEEFAKSASSEDDGTPRKKRKTSKGSQASTSTGVDSSAISCVMTAGIASAVLTSLPLHLLPEDERQSVLHAVQEYFDASQPLLKHASKQIPAGSGSGSGTQNWQIVASALLHLRFALSSERRLQLETDGNTKVVKKLIPLLRMDTLMSQLRVEIVSMHFLCFAECQVRLMDVCSFARGCWTWRRADRSPRPALTKSLTVSRIYRLNLCHSGAEICMVL
jgi:hypothetical protein